MITTKCHNHGNMSAEIREVADFLTSCYNVPRFKAIDLCHDTRRVWFVLV